MICTECKRPITIDNIVMTPLLSLREPNLIDNITIYSKDCVENGCQHHIHIMNDEGWNTIPPEKMTLKELIIRERLAEEE